MKVIIYIACYVIFYLLAYYISLLINRKSKREFASTELLESQFSDENIHFKWQPYVLYLIYFLIMTFGVDVLKLIAEESFFYQYNNFSLYFILFLITFAFANKFLIENAKSLKTDFTTQYIADKDKLKKWNKTQSVADKRFNIALIIYFLSFIFMIGWSIFCANIIKTTNANSEGINKLPLWEQIVCGIIFAPLIEEVIYRGIIFRFFRKKTKYFAHIVSAIVFGYTHIIGNVVFQGAYIQLIA